MPSFASPHPCGQDPDPAGSSTGSLTSCAGWSRDPLVIRRFPLPSDINEGTAGATGPDPGSGQRGRRFLLLVRVGEG